MKVLLCHKFHHITGGAEVFYFEVARALKENGHTVAFFTTEDRRNTETGDKLYTVPAPNYQSGSLIEKLRGTCDIFYSEAKKNKFLEAIDEFRPDVIHAFAIHVHLTPAILESAFERGVPVVMSCNDYKHICPNYKLFDGRNICEACKGGKFYNATLKRCCKNSLTISVASTIEAYIHNHKKVYDRLISRYLFASEFMMEKTKEFWEEKDVEYGMLKNPFKVSTYEPVYSGDYVLYFGRIIEEKGVDRIVEAAKLVDVPIKIVGDGPDLEKLKAVVKKHELKHVEFLGAMWGEQLDQVLYGARFVVVPSLWHENFPYVIFQAFAAGKPVVGSMRGGIPELIGEQRGVTFEPNHIDEFAQCMVNLWHDVERCRNMGRLAREYIVKEFSDQAFYEALMSNYNAVIKSI